MVAKDQDGGEKACASLTAVVGSHRGLGMKYEVIVGTAFLLPLKTEHPPYTGDAPLQANKTLV